MTKPNDGKMGIWMTTALVVGTIIGAGIFMLPVSLAPLGRNSIIGWVVSGMGALCIVFALAQISRLGGNGIQANIEREFGPTIAFLDCLGILDVQLGSGGLGRGRGGINFVVPWPAIRWRRCCRPGCDRLRCCADCSERARRPRCRRPFDCHRCDQGPAIARGDLAVLGARGERRSLRAARAGERQRRQYSHRDRSHLFRIDRV